MTNYEIIDDSGVIHSSTDKEEMQIAFDCMKNPDKYDKQERELWECDWSGDLKLVEVINVTR